MEKNHIRIELLLGIIGAIVAIAGLIVALNSWKLEYNQHRPNLSITTEVVTDDNTGEEVTKCIVKNDGDTIREATITPHVYFRYLNVPDLSGDYENIFVVEITDVFATYYGNGLFGSSVVYYNPVDCNWVMEVDKAKIEYTFSMLTKIGDQMEGDLIASSYELLLEVSYIDIMGKRKTEWYNTADAILTGIGTEDKSSEPYQLNYISEDSWIPLSMYTDAPSVILGNDENLFDVQVEYLVEACQNGMFADK